MKKIFKRMVKFFKKRPGLLIFTLLLFIVLISYGETLKMYWWVDDWGLLFKMIHPESAPGNLGHGIWGEGAYRFLATPFIFLYPILGLDATPYFGLGLLQYLILSFVVYLFVKKLSGDLLTSLGSAVIFASGYMGSYALYRLSNSYQLIDTGILLILTVYALIHYFQTRKLRFYMLSLILFASTINFFFLRAHGIIFVVAAAIFLFAEKRLNPKNILKNFLRFIPFLFIYYYFYILGYLGGPEFNYSSSANFIGEFLKIVFRERHFGMIGNFFVNFADLIIPYDFSKYFYESVFKAWYSNLDSFIAILGIILFGLICLFWFFLWLKQKKNSKLLLFSLIWLIANYVTYFIYNPATNLFSTARYLIPSFIGSSMLLSVILFELGILGGSAKGIKRLLGFIPISLVAFCFIYLTRGEEKAIIGYASIPTKGAYEAVRKEVSKVDGKTLFFFELEDNSNLKAHLLGGMGQLGISIFFNYNGETKIADTYEEVFYLLSSGRASIDNLYGFYGGIKEGFTSFTEKFRKLLLVGGNEEKLTKWSSKTGAKQSGNEIVTETKLVKTEEGGMAGVNPDLETETNYDSMVPSELTLKMKISPLASSLKFPFSDVTAKFPRPESFSTLVSYKPLNEKGFNKSDIIGAIKEENERQEFLRTAKVTTSSSWKNREAIYLNDGNLDSNWNAHIALWNTGKRPEEVTIDLGRIETISKLIWINNYPPNTPTVYTIYSSNDGKTWFKLVDRSNKAKRDALEVITENFPTISTRFLKMSIYDTFSGNAPSIVELWTSGVKGDFDLLTHNQIISCPFCFVSDINTYQELAYHESKIATARLWWVTNRNENYYLPYSNSFPIFIDGKTHIYHLIIPAQGTILEKIKIDGFAVPVKITIENAVIRSLSLSEIKDKGLIHEFGGEDIRLNK